MESMNNLVKFVMYPPPSNLFISAMSMVSFISLANAGFSEIRGKNLKYSKFRSSNSNAKQMEISGKNGMLLCYAPAFVVGSASFALFPSGEGLKLLLIKSALTIHFFKRLIEVLFIHEFSGGTDLGTAITISLSYAISTATMIYSQYLTQGHPEPQINLSYPGIVMFVIGICGNFYHHYLLSKLRSKSTDKEYKIPKGGLFDLVICPHYLFEILGFWGVSFISQTLYASCFTTGTTLYLMGRSYATRRWYQSKFDDFPKNIKALVPFVF